MNHLVKKAFFVWLFLTTTMAATFAQSGIAINETNFPDDNFRAWALSQPWGSSAFLTKSDANQISSLNLSGMGIKNLKGIEYFDKLESLNCSENHLVSLSVVGLNKLAVLNAEGQEVCLPSLYEAGDLYFSEEIALDNPTLSSFANGVFYNGVSILSIYDIEKTSFEVDVEGAPLKLSGTFHFNDCGGAFFCHYQGHDFEMMSVPPTRTDKGYIMDFCVRCGAQHFFNYRVRRVIPPTCTAEGYTMYVHPFTGEKHFGNYVPVSETDHKIVNAIWKDCDVFDHFVVVRSCDNHQMEISYDKNWFEALDIDANYAMQMMLASKPDCSGCNSAPVVTPPTCTEDGYTTYTIACDDICCTYMSNYVDALGHEFIEEVHPPTCTKVGYLINRCVRCGVKHVIEVLSPLENSWQTIVVTQPTCEKQGYTTYINPCDGSSKNDDYVDMLTEGCGEDNMYAQDNQLKKANVSNLENLESRDDKETRIIEDAISVYPNPTVDKVHLSANVNIKLYTQQGVLLYSGTGNEIDLTAHPKGLYILKINDNMTVKVIKL